MFSLHHQRTFIPGSCNGYDFSSRWSLAFKKFKFHKLDNIAIGEKAFLLKLNSNLIWFWQAVESDWGEDDNCQASLIHRHQFFCCSDFFQFMQPPFPINSVCLDFLVSYAHTRQGGSTINVGSYIMSMGGFNAHGENHYHIKLLCMQTRTPNW